MKNILLFSPLCLLMLFTLCFQTPPKRVIYYQRPADYDPDSIFMDSEGAIHIQTERDINPFLEALKNNFGTPDEAAEDALRWLKKPLFSQEKVDLNVFTLYRLDIVIYDQSGSLYNVAPIAFPFFKNLYQQYILTQPLPPKPPPMQPLNIQYELDQLLGCNQDSLAQLFDEFCNDTTYEFNIYFDINQYGQCNINHQIMASNIPNKALLNKVKQIILGIDFPLLVDSTLHDTLPYQVEWQQVFSNNALKNWYVKKIEHQLKTKEAPFENVKLPEEARDYRWGQWFDPTRTHLYLRLPDGYSKLYLFEIKNQQLIELEHFDVGSFCPFIKLEDLNNDPIPEILAESHPNMNGNQWISVISYNPATHSFVRSGNYTTDYTIDRQQKKIFVEYSGSWYMDHSRTCYQWRGLKLLPLKEARIQLTSSMTGTENFLYLENPFFTSGIDTLILQKEWLNDEKNPEIQRLWDDIFKDKPKE
jgi:hypothetical protein